MARLLITMALVMCTVSEARTQTKRKLMEYLITIGCKHPDIVWKQAILETGHLTSYSCTKRHNLFGLRYKGEWMEFNCWQESCNAYLCKIQYKYEGGDYYRFLVEIGYSTSGWKYIEKLKTIKSWQSS